MILIQTSGGLKKHQWSRSKSKLAVSWLNCQPLSSSLQWTWNLRPELLSGIFECALPPHFKKKCLKETQYETTGPGHPEVAKCQAEPAARGWFWQWKAWPKLTLQKTWRSTNCSMFCLGLSLTKINILRKCWLWVVTVSNNATII